MKRQIIALATAAILGAGIAVAAEVRDWEDLRATHEKIQGAIQDLARAQRANHYDMGGHAAKAEQLLRQAEHELHEAVESARQRH